MTAATARRLKRLEGEMGPRDLGHYHCIYARDRADFEQQRADLIASGRAKANDLIVDGNWRTWEQRGRSEDTPEYSGDLRPPETLPWTKTWMQYINEWDAAKRQEKGAA